MCARARAPFLGIVFVGLVGLIAPRAHAGGSDTSSIACGWSQSGWSAPKGALVANYGSGPVRAVLQALGETRTHIILSHGPGNWATQSTMFDPGTNGWPTYCDTPVRAGEMRHGYPGGSQVQQGGIYTYLFGHGAQHYVGYTIAPSGANRSVAAATADYAWYEMPWVGTTSMRDGNQGFYLLGETEKKACYYNNWNSYWQNNCLPEWFGDGFCDCGCQTEDPDCVANSGFHRIEYSFFNYLNTQGRPFSEWTTEHGSQCSSFIAQLYRLEAGDYIDPATYSHAQVVAAGNALYSAVYSECKSGLGDWGNIGAAVTCAFPYFDLDICDDAARQVRNCFINPGYCNSSSSSPWSSLAGNQSVLAWSVSPDRLVGVGAHNPSGRAHTGPWAGNAEVAVQWNSGGNVYGCWY
jgi:hypothetical protein